jgi:cytochrome c-type biogenesis protein CcmH
MRFLRSPLRLVLVAVLALIVLGADGDNTRRFSDLGHRLMCNCGCNQILLECNHVGCSVSERMRGEVNQQMSDGKGDEDVLQYFVKQYGAVVLAAPPNRGFGRVAWITPFAAFGGGLLLVAFVVRNWKLRPATVIPAKTNMPEMELDEYRRRARKETDL